MLTFVLCMVIDRLGVYFILVPSWYWMLQTWSSYLVWICFVSTRYLFALPSPVISFFYHEFVKSLNQLLRAVYDRFEGQCPKNWRGRGCSTIFARWIFLCICSVVKITMYFRRVNVFFSVLGLIRERHSTPVS